MAFLSLLVRGAEGISVQPDLAMLEKIFSVEAASAGSTATASAAAARTAVSNLVGKIVAVVAAVALGGGAIGVYMALNQPSAEVPIEPTVQAVETIAPTEHEIEPTEAPTEAVLYDYEELIEDYAAIINGEISIDEAGIDLSQSALYITPSSCYIDQNGFFVYRYDVRYHIAGYDINGDQIKELIILEEGSWGACIMDIFTFCNGKPVWLIAGAERGRVDLYENGVIGMYGSGGAEAHGYYFYQILDGELVLLDAADSDWGTYEVNGVECSKEVHDELVSRYIRLDTWNFDIVRTIEREDS